MSKYLNPYTDFGLNFTDYEESLRDLWDITNAMNDAENKGFGKGKELD